MEASILLPLSAECLSFLRSCLLGVILGVFFDLFRILRRSFKCSGVVIAAQDMFYCFVAGYVTFCFLLKNCDGRLRWFVFCGELIGWVIFRLTLGNLFVALGYGILSALIRLIKFIFHIIISPFLILWRVFGVKVKSFIKERFKYVKKVCQNRKFRLKKQAALLYNYYIPHFGGRIRSAKQGGKKMAKRKKRKANWFVRLFMLCFVTYVAVSLIGMQVEVTSKRRQLLALQQNVEQQKMVNAEMQRDLNGDTDEDYIERIARDKLGYAYPDEKIFIDRSGN